MITRLYDNAIICSAQRFLDERKYLAVDKWAVPESLYSYTGLYSYEKNKIRRDIVDDLNDNLITVSSPSLFNDAYDSTIHLNTTPMLVKNLLKNLGASYNDISQQLIEQIENTVSNVDMFRMTDLPAPLRIKCLSEHKCSTMLWAHYADSNRGICIEYSPDTWHNKESKFFPVIYTEAPIDFSELCENDLPLMLLLSSINKSKEWENELEWRYILNVYDSENRLPPRTRCINATIPRSVTLGRSFKQCLTQSRSKEERTIAIKLLKWLYNNKIATYETDYIFNSYNLQIVPVQWASSDYNIYLEDY